MKISFTDAIIYKKKAGLIPVIPDIKRISPKDGELFMGRDPIETVKVLEKAGAPALSVVTEEKSFGGSRELFERIAGASSLPVLRKDFITSEQEVKATKEIGAQAVLLICAIQPSFRNLAKLYEQALKAGLVPLVEVHTKEEMLMAKELDAKVVGINNRDILLLEKDDGDVGNTELLARYKPQDALIISESSIRTPSQAQAAISAGADAVLVGTSLWQAEDMTGFYIALSSGTGASQ